MKKSAIILAGGKGSRLKYTEKALLKYNNMTLLENTLNILKPITDEIIISLRDIKQKELFSEYLTNSKIVYDQYNAKGPIGGIVSALESTTGKYVFIVACDMPFLNINVIKIIFEKSIGYYGAVPVWKNGNCEPLHAVYQTSILKTIAQTCIKQEKYSVVNAVSKMSNINYIDMDIIKIFDPDLRSFININEPIDVEKII